MLNRLFTKKFFGKVMAIICSFAILCPNAALAATVTDWTELVADIAVTGATNTTTLTGNISADTTASLGAQGATALTITSDDAQETRAIVGDGVNNQGITVSAGQTLTLNNIVLNNLKNYAVNNQGSLVLQGTSAVANSNIIDSQATKTGQITIEDGVNLNMLEHTLSQSTIINNGNLVVTLNNMSVDNDITNNGNMYINGATTEEFRHVLNNNITGTGMVFFGPRATESNYTEIAEGKEISTNVQIYGLGTYYTAGVTNSGTISGDVDVRVGGVLTSNLSNLTGSAINNFGTINATGGTLGTAITDVNHTGTLNIKGNVTNGGYNIQQNKINIEQNTSLVTNASNLNITDKIYNASMLQLTGGTNTAEVAGLTISDTLYKGYVRISGDTINNADMDILELLNYGSATLTNNAGIVTENSLNINTSGLQINGTGSIDVDGLTVGSNATLTQTGGITTHGMVQNAGTITGDMTLLYHGYGNNEFYQYGTVDGNVTLDSTYNSYLFMENGSSITGQIINNGGVVVATEGSGTLNITGGITRTEEGRGNFYVGYNHFDYGTVNIQSAVEKQNITVGYYNNATLQNILNVTHEDASIDNSSITINAGQTLNANASKITNSTYLNNGTLNFTSGANANYIAQSSQGTVQISGDVSNSANIYQANLQVDEGCTFTNTNTGSISLDGNGTNAGNLFGAGSILNNGFIAAHNGLDTRNGVPTISGSGSLEVFDEFYIGTGKTIAQSSINTHDLAWNYGTINSNVLLLGNDDFYHYGTIGGNVFLHESYEGDLFMKNGSSITGQITNDGGNLVATENTGTLNITGGITRTEDGRGNFLIGWNANDTGIVNIKSTVEKQNIIIGSNGSSTTLNVTDENALINNSGITINTGKTLNANASKITNSTIQNNGNLNFVGGENANAITGTGTLGVSGTVVNNATINQASLTLADEANFTSYEDITLSDSADITNSGSFALNGANLDIGTANIINNGTMSMDGSSYLTAGNLTNNAGHYLTIRNPNSLNLSGTFTNGGDVFLQGTLPEGFAITRTGNGKINVASGGPNSLTINNGVDLGNHSIVTYGSTSLYVNADTFGNTITGAGDVYLRSGTFTGDIQIYNSDLHLDSDSVVNFEGEDIMVDGTGNIYITEDTTLNVSGDSYITGVINNAGTINLSGEFGGAGNREITGSGVTNIPSGANAYVHNNIINTVNVAQTATLNVDSDNLANITFGNTTINGTLGLTLTEITADSSTFTGTSLTASNLTLGENAALSLTVTDPDALERGQQTGELSLINATYADDRDFATMFANNMYSVLPGTTLGKYIIAKLKTPEQIVDENGGTKNNVETGNSWDAVNKAELNAKAQDVYNELFDLEQHDAKGYIEKLNQIAPQGTQAVLAATQGLNNLIGANVAARVAQIGKGKAGGDFFTEGSLWLEALYSHSNRSGDGEFSGNTYGANFGIDGKVADTTTLGFGYAFNSTKLDANIHDLNANGHTLFTYALYQPSQWYLRGLLNYGFAKYDDKNSTNSTDYNVQNIGVQIAGGYQIDEHWTPEAALRYTHLMTDDYTDLLGQKVKNDDNDVLTLVLGAKYETDIKTRNGFRWTPQAHLNLTYDIVSDDGKATVVLADQTYQIKSKKLDAFGVEAGVGAEMGITDKIGLNLSYDFTLKGKFTNHTGALKGVYHF